MAKNPRSFGWKRECRGFALLAAACCIPLLIVMLVCNMVLPEKPKQTIRPITNDWVGWKF